MSLTPPGLTKEILKAFLDFAVAFKPEIASSPGFGLLVRKTEEKTYGNWLASWCQHELDLYYSLLEEFKEVFSESLNSRFFVEHDFTLN